MSRTALIVLVSLAGYGVLAFALSAITAVVWRTRAVAPANLPPAVRARRLLQLRTFPVVTAAALTLFVIIPAFAIFEPASAGEEIGPVLELLSLMVLFQIGASIVVAVQSAMLTRRVEREWLRGSESIDASQTAGLRAFAIASASPMVALVGVFAPKLIAARSVVDACTPEEIACIVAHERGHFDARDNMKRWLMASLPDPLRWTAIHREIVVPQGPGDAWPVTPGECPDSRQEFVEGKGLGQVVVRARIETAHDVLGRVTGGQHENRGFDALATQLTGEFEPALLGKLDVQHDQVIGTEVSELGALLAVGCHVHSVTLFLQPLLEEPGRLRIVLHHENAQGAPSR